MARLSAAMLAYVYGVVFRFEFMQAIFSDWEHTGALICNEGLMICQGQSP